MTRAGSSVLLIAWFTILVACTPPAQSVLDPERLDRETVETLLRQGPVVEVDAMGISDRCDITEVDTPERTWVAELCVWSGTIVASANNGFVVGEVFAAVAPCRDEETEIAPFVTYGNTPTFAASCWNAKSLIATRPLRTMSRSAVAEMILAHEPAVPGEVPFDPFLVADSDDSGAEPAP